jgi:hypothetical protein
MPTGVEVPHKVRAAARRWQEPERRAVSFIGYTNGALLALGW